MRFLMMFLTVFMIFGHTTTFAATLAKTLEAEYKLNQASPNAMATQQLGTTLHKGRIHVARATYDFAVLGGAVGAVNLKSDQGTTVILPNKALIVGCYIDVATAGTTAASGTIALGTGQAANDLKAALAAASYTGIVACVPTGTAASSIKLTADRTMTATIATGAITAGKFTVFVEYIMGSN